MEYLLAGISVGGQYALIAIGYTMVYGILRLINFAHGDIFMVSGLVMVYATTAMPICLSRSCSSAPSFSALPWSAWHISRCALRPVCR